MACRIGRWFVAIGLLLAPSAKAKSLPPLPDTPLSDAFRAAETADRLLPAESLDEEELADWYERRHLAVFSAHLLFMSALGKEPDLAMPIELRVAALHRAGVMWAEFAYVYAYARARLAPDHSWDDHHVFDYDFDIDLSSYLRDAGPFMERCVREAAAAQYRDETSAACERFLTSYAMFRYPAFDEYFPLPRRASFFPARLAADPARLQHSGRSGIARPIAEPKE